jgi:hypothetical protein
LHGSDGHPQIRSGRRTRRYGIGQEGYAGRRRKRLQASSSTSETNGSRSRPPAIRKPPLIIDVEGSDKKLQKALTGIFSVACVRIVYKENGDKRQLVSIERTGAKGPGKVTGIVVATHVWCVAVKPNATYPADHCKKMVEKFREVIPSLFSITATSSGIASNPFRSPRNNPGACCCSGVLII